jgi:hypothetical protein
MNNCSLPSYYYGSVHELFFRSIAETFFRNVHTCEIFRWPPYDEPCADRFLELIWTSCYNESTQILFLYGPSGDFWGRSNFWMSLHSHTWKNEPNGLPFCVVSRYVRWPMSSHTHRKHFVFLRAYYVYVVLGSRIFRIPYRIGHRCGYKISGWRLIRAHKIMFKINTKKFSFMIAIENLEDNL